MINPRSKREKYLAYKIVLPKIIKVFAPDEVSKKVLKVLEIFLDDVKLEYEFVDEAEKAFFKIYHTAKKQTRLERYKLFVDKTGITASFECFMGGRNAMASLYQLMHRENNEISIDAANLDDWADVSHRELMLEMCFKGMPPERIKRIMVDMALSKMNVLHMHLMDNRTLALQFDAYPAANNKKWEYYTKDEM
jgi:N-acetyl-beta-hexosaminidase